MTNKEFIEHLETLDLDATVVFPYEDMSIFTFNPLSKSSIKEVKVKVKGKELTYVCIDSDNHMDIK